MAKLVRLSHPYTFPFDRDAALSPFEKVVDDIFSEAFPDFNKMFGVSPMENNAYPRVDILEYDDKVEVFAEISGYNKEDVAVEVVNGCLQISGIASTKEHTENKNARYIRKELKRSKFVRSFSLGEELDAKAITAKFENGMLNITIPKIVENKPTKQSIEIE